MMYFKGQHIYYIGPSTLQYRAHVQPNEMKPYKLRYDHTEFVTKDIKPIYKPPERKSRNYFTLTLITLYPPP